MMLSRLILILSVLVGGMVSPALAQRPGLPEAEQVELEKSARKACIVGDYAKGVDILADLFIAVRDPVYLYNQARCFQQNHQWQPAIDRFNEYLRKAKNVPATVTLEVNAHIAECEAALHKSPLVPRDPPPSPLPATPAKNTPDPTMEDRGSGWRTAGVVIGAIGLAGAIGGVFCSVKTYQLRDQPDQLDRYKTAGLLSYGVGAVGLATGLTFYLVGNAKQGAAATEISLVPQIGMDRTTVSVQGTF